VEIVEIDEASWSDVLDEYDPDDKLTATVREHLTPAQQCVLRELRDVLPEHRREES